MEIFDKISKKASEAYKITADKTGKIARETKLKLRMGEIKTKTNEVYQEIYYSQFKYKFQRDYLKNNVNYLIN